VVSLRILNEEELLRNAVDLSDKEARYIALEALKAGVDAVDPRNAVKNFVRSDGYVLKIGNEDLSFNLNGVGRVVVVGGGKASGAMAEALEEVLDDRLDAGFVNVLKGTGADFKVRRVQLNEAGHPIPDEAGLEGSRKIIELLQGLHESDLVFCLISGGGSALMPLPAEGISLQDKKNVTNMLVNRSPATIEEINAVRKHLSVLKGGQLARLAYPATLISLILSDIVGDPLGSIASGPTAPDPTTFNDAVAVLKRYNLWADVPEPVHKRLEAGLRGDIPETPKPGDKVFDKTHNIIVGNNRLAASAACREAQKHGLHTLLLSSLIEGEARHVGTAYAGIAKEVVASGHPVQKPAAIIAGGETTVTVTGEGRGGRNQELTLSAALKMIGLKGAVIASIGTDGLDGPTDAAGAVVDGQTFNRARCMGLNPLDYLKKNDSYTFFKKLNDNIITGPTKTNVNDLAIIVVLR